MPSIVDTLHLHPSAFIKFREHPNPWEQVPTYIPSWWWFCKGFSYFTLNELTFQMKILLHYDMMLFLLNFRDSLLLFCQLVQRTNTYTDGFRRLYKFFTSDQCFVASCMWNMHSLRTFFHEYFELSQTRPWLWMLPIARKCKEIYVVRDDILKNQPPLAFPLPAMPTGSGGISQGAGQQTNGHPKWAPVASWVEFNKKQRITLKVFPRKETEKDDFYDWKLFSKLCASGFSSNLAQLQRV